jgi:hypothetical protein
MILGLRIMQQSVKLMLIIETRGEKEKLDALNYSIKRARRGAEASHLWLYMARWSAREQRRNSGSAFSRPRAGGRRKSPYVPKYMRERRIGKGKTPFIHSQAELASGLSTFFATYGCCGGGGGGGSPLLFSLYIYNCSPNCCSTRMGQGHRVIQKNQHSSFFSSRRTRFRDTPLCSIPLRLALCTIAATSLITMIIYHN